MKQNVRTSMLLVNKYYFDKIYIQENLHLVMQLFVYNIFVNKYRVSAYPTCTFITSDPAGLISTYRADPDAYFNPYTASLAFPPSVFKNVSVK